jgi:hypothetical protein
MLWLNPTAVDLFGAALGGVSSVAVDRAATRSAEERGDLGPHVVFADAPEQRVTVRVRRRVDEASAGALSGVAVGAMGELSFRVSASRSDRGGRVVRATVVVRGVDHALSERDGFVQTITMTAVSSDGAADPIVEEGDTA